MRTKMFRITISLFLLGSLLAPSLVLAEKAEPPSLDTLEPGGFKDIEQDLTTNVVFVGYEPGTGHTDIDQAAFLAELPDTYRPVNRFPSDYKGNEFLGLTFNYEYNLVYADHDFEDNFFDYLGSIATPMPLTLYQDGYNDQAAATGFVSDNHWIDAPSVERTTS